MFFDRGLLQPSAANKKVTQTKIFPAPTRGWIRNENLSTPKGGGAEVMDNWFPTPEGARMRKGSALHGTCDTAAAITHIATYETGAVSKMFATDADAIYDVTSPADADTAITAEVTGLAGGAWSSTQFQAAGGSYLVMVNGTDDMRMFDGTYLFPVTATAVNRVSYDAETGAFTAGLTLTGGTSGATATIIKVIDNGTTGTLLLGAITGGPFQDNEALTDSSTGAATANGASAQVAAAITGSLTSDFSSVWGFKNRLFFIEGGTLSAWYLPVGAVGGAATELSLGGNFKYGGSLLFGATFSRDAGAGLDDFCIFVTENGEIAVYQGTDPSSADTWALVGVYKVGKPLGKNAFFKAGGDVAIATDDGIVSVNQALSQDRAGQRPITYPIEEAWRNLILERAFSGFDFQTVLWHKESMLVVAVPAFAGLDAYCLVANSKSGAWARYTGWDMRAVAVFGDELYFGTSDGLIVQGETGGSDQDVTYSAICIPRFDTFGQAEEKVAMHARVVARTNHAFTTQVFAAADYVYDIPAALPADPDAEGDTWGSGIWGEAIWGGQTDSKRVSSEWQSVGAYGHALTPGIMVSSGRATEPDFELIALHLQYQVGSVMV